MIRHIALAAAAASLSLTLAATAGAQAQSMPHFGVSVGASIPESTFGESVNTGYNLNGMFNVTVPLSPLGFRGEVGWNRFDLNSATGNGNVRIASGSANNSFGRPLARVHSRVWCEMAPKNRARGSSASR